MKIKRNSKLKTACAAAAVATCWGVGQQAQAVPVEMSPASITLTPTTAISDLYFLYGVGYSGTTGYAIELDDAVIGENTYNVMLDVDEFVRDSGEFFYTVIGVYSDPSNPDAGERSGVSITLSEDNAETRITNSETFEDYFGVDFTEADIQTALENDTVSTLIDFFVYHLPTAFVDLNFANSGTQVNFSEADFGGSVSLLPSIPEPTTAMLLCTGAGVLALGRRKRA